MRKLWKKLSHFFLCQRRRRLRFRTMIWEQLEDRRVMAIDGWTNVLQPYSVLNSTSQDVSALDVLAIVNEINGPKYSDSNGRLPATVSAEQRPPYFDVNCNGFVEALDALSLINHLNGGSKPHGWKPTDLDSQSGAGFVSNASCSPKLNEGDSLRTTLKSTLVLPDDSSAVRVLFENPAFDTTSVDSIRDAFEIVVTDASGNPIVLPYSPRLEATFNISESIASTYGPSLVPGNVQQTPSATINLTGLAAGTTVHVAVRLLNNDGDRNSSVILRAIEVIDAIGPNPTSSVWSTANSVQASSPIVWNQMEDLSGNYAARYGRTTYTNNRQSLITEFSIENRGNSVATGTLLAVIDSLSDLNVSVVAPDGWTADGRPFLLIDAGSNGALSPGEVSVSKELRFANPSSKQFKFDVKVLGSLHRQPPVFTSTPISDIQAGNPYRYQAIAKSPVDAGVLYSAESAPAGMALDAATGELRWPTQSVDVGRHSIVLVATDEFGLQVRQRFSIEVRASFVNRPPIFTSTPETDEVISSPFEVQTYATGIGPVAVDVLSQTNGSMSLVTANAGEEQLGYLAGSPQHFGSTKPISIGEPTPSILSTPFTTGYSVPLDLAPNTFGNYQRDIQGVLTEDVNGDGIPDLIVLANLTPGGNWNDARDRGYVIVRLGNGEGTFREGWRASLPVVAGRIGRAASAHLKDVTGDGRLDLIVTTIATNQTLVYAGNSASLFDTNPIVSPNSGNYVANTQMADLNGDGKLDLILFESEQVQIGGRRGIGVQLGDGTGRFSGTTLLATANNNGGYGYVADVDGVNGPDLIRLNYNDTRLEVRLNNGTGQFGDTINTVTRSYFNSSNTGARNVSPTTATIDDFDGDRKVDALLSTNQGVVLLQGQGNGQFGNGTQSGNAVVVNSNFDEPRWPGIANSDGRGEDLNGDGKLDFVFGDTQNAGNIMIGLGNGNGTFAIQQYNASFDDDIGQGIVRNSRTTQYIALADFNRDGVIDIAAGASQRDQQPGAVGIFLGDLPGTLRAPNFVNSYAYNQDYSAVKARSGESATGDFNGDGYVDIVTMGGASSGTAFFFAAGKGDGTFAPYETALGGIQGCSSLIALDIDRDGILDLAWMDGGRFGQAFGLGNGAFQYLPTIPSQGSGAGGVSQQILQTDDFNRDGYPDLVYRLQTGNIDTNLNTKIVVLIYDPANRRYRELPDASNLITLTPRAYGFYHDEALGMGDLNNDGVKEFFAFSRNNPNNGTLSRFSIYEQTGNVGNDASVLFRKTVIENPSFIPADQSIHSFVVGDFNHDGKNDIAYSTHSATTVVMFGNGDFTFRDPTIYLTNGFLLNKGDFNGDGLTDLVTTWGYGFLSYSQRPFNSVLLGRADGTFSEQYGFTTATSSTNGLFVGDFNGDGVDDFTGLGGLKHNEAFIGKTKGLSDIATGDINGDGRPDTVSVVAGLDRVKLLHGVVDETFARQPDLFTDLFPVAVELVDADNDDLLDILTANQVGMSLSLFKHTSPTVFARTDIDLAIRPTELILGDLNGDGKTDAVAISSLDQTLVGLLAGNDTFGVTLVLPLGFSPSGVAAGDVSGDGKLDLVLSDSAGNRLIVLQGRGDGTFLAPFVIPAIHAPGAMGIADTNADGRLDIVVAQPEDDRVALVFNRGTGRFTAPQIIQVGDKPSAIEIRDINKDNKPDILVPNQGDNTVSVILNRFDPNQVWTYKPTAIDPDGDAVTFDVTSAPGGMLYDSDSNTIYWAPMPEQIGRNSVVLTTSDGNGGSTEQGFVVTVSAPVTVVPPIFTSTPVTTFGADSVYRYEPNVQAIENGPKRFSLVEGPAGMTIDPTTGVLDWDDRSQGIKLFANYADPGSPISNRNNGQIQIPDSPSLRSASVTAEGWFNFEDPKGALFDQLLSKQLSTAGTSFPSWGLEYYYGTLRANVGKPGQSTSLATVTAPAPIEFNKWTHIALTFDDSPKQLTLYVNGKNVGSAISPESIGYNALPLVSGSNYITLSRVKVWNTARSASDIAALALADIPSNTPGLVLDLKFHESKDVSTILDASTAKNHGSLIGTPDVVNFPIRVPALASQGSYPVTIRVEDGKGGVTDQSFAVSVKTPATTQVAGTVFDDLNGNGIWDRRSGQNLVFNGDFGSGAVGFTTDFVQRNGADTFGWLGNSQWTVSNATKAFPLTSDYTAHTDGSTSDLMLLANGDTQDRVAWRQSIPTVSGQSYEFSFWAIRANSHEAPRLAARVNGQVIGSTLSLSDVGLNGWKRFLGTLQANSNTTLVEIVLLGSTTAPNPGLGGAENVVGIDDVLFLSSSSRRVVVSGKANPYLAGMPDGSTAFGGTAPAASPPSVAVAAGQVLRFSATGHTIADGFFSSRSPDGLVYISTGLVTQSALNGISQFSGPHYGSLLGVFLDDNSPAGQSPPVALDFRATGNVLDGINYSSLQPAIRQVFFIGDGRTADGVEQSITVPPGATRLFFANSSTSNWNNNSGDFEVQVFDSISEPVQANRQVFVDSNFNGRLDASEPSTLTNSRGVYAFPIPGTAAQLGLVGKQGELQTAPGIPYRTFDTQTDVFSIDFGSRDIALSEPPRFTTQPVTAAIAPGEYQYQSFAQSPSGKPMSYALAVGPQGMSIDPSSGLVRWNPIASNRGDNEVILKATDADGKLTLQRFTIQVEVNTIPIVTSIPPAIALKDVQFEHRVLAQDAEQSDLRYSLTTAPSGMTIDAVSGLIQWLPSSLGAENVTVKIDDQRGGFTEQAFSLAVQVAGLNRAPQLSSGPRAIAVVGREFASRIGATDADNDVLSYTLVSWPNGLTLSSQGEVYWEPSLTGSFDFVARVSDGRGGTDEQSYTLNVASRAPTPDLQITSSPTTAAVVGELFAYDVVAIHGELFELVTSPTGMSIASARGTIRWIPTKDQLGVQTIKIRVTDVLGNLAEQSFVISVRSSSLVPTISSAPLTEGAVGQTYVYGVAVANPSKSPLTYSLSVAPAGMQIDTALGVITWTPNSGQIGPTVVSIQVRDAVGNFSSQTFSVVVSAGAFNRPPVTASTPSIDAVVGQSYVYTMVANDPEGGTLTYAVRSAPSGLSIDPNTGIVTWTPSASDIGTVAIVLTTTDPLGGVAVQSVQIDVRAANRLPVVRSNPVLKVSQGAVYQYDVLATDPDREPLYYSLLTAPAGMTIDPLGRIRWQTKLDTPLGGRDVVVRVVDGLGGAVTQSFTFGVVSDTLAPRITIIVGGEPVLYPWTTGPAVVRVIATDDVGLTRVELRVDGKPVELAPDGTARVYFSAPGNGRLEARAFDAAGNVGTALGRVSMRSGEEDGGGNPAPEATITSVSDGATVGGFVNIVGTAAAPDFARYVLSYRRIDDSSYKTILNATTQVTAGSLGKWDTTLLENDNYVLKLEVYDTFGSFAAVEVEVSVSSNLKLGNFRLSFEDMTIPVAGIPITIVRTYDTLRADRDGDFGYGWRMEYRNTDLRTSLPKSGLEDIGLYTPFKPGTKVFLTLPGGERQGFTFTPEIKVLPGYGQGNNLVLASPRFTPDRGVTSTLSAGSGALIANAFGELYASGGVPWNPASPDFGGYTLTTREGLTYRIDGSGRLLTAVDRNLNTLTFSESGVTTSAGGVAIQIERDTRGRITTVTDPAGSQVRYQYDSRGDLVQVTDRMDRTSTYAYLTSHPHYLDKIVDPLARMGVRTNYDSDGRIIGTQGNDGSRITRDYDLDIETVTTTDAVGRISILQYDGDGNVVSLTNGLGNTTRYTYDGNGNLLSTIDPLGRTTLSQYDALGRLTDVSDPRGNTTRFVYDAFSNVTRVVDPIGRVTSNTYDERGNQLTVTDATGATTRTVYDAQGNRTQIVDSQGQQSFFTYDPEGFLTSVIDRSGSQTTFIVDPLGQPKTLRQEQSINGSIVETESRYEYDKSGKLTKMIGPDGVVTSVDFNDAGEEESIRDPLGLRTQIHRDSMGRITSTEGTGGSNSPTTIYDPSGKPAIVNLPNGGSIQYVYDAAGQLTRTLLPDGSQRITAYDAAGQVVSTSGYAGSGSSKYDDAGRLIEETTSGGRSTRYEYDAAGRISAVIDPLGNRSTVEYDAADRVTALVLADGSRETFAYDSLGRTTALQESLQSRKTVTYTPGNQIQSVTVGGATTAYLYDSSGNMIGLRDSKGLEFAFEFDANRNLTKRTLPSGRQQTFQREDLGRIISSTDPSGTTTRFTYNTRNQVTSRISGTQSETYEYDANGNLIRVNGPWGVTNLEYDANGDFSKIIDGQGVAVTYKQGSFGLTSVSTDADTSTMVRGLDGELLSKTDASGTTRYSYDGAGRVKAVEYPNGMRLDLEYDLMGRTTHRRYSLGTRSILEQTYSVQNGRWVAVNDGGTSNVSFTYDQLGNLTVESYGDGYIAYRYDSTGNILSRSTQQSSESFVVDEDDRLISMGATQLTWNASGTLATRTRAGVVETFSYDARDRMTSYRRLGNSPTTIEYEYDHNGLLSARTVNGVRWQFVWDRSSALAILLEVRDANNQVLVRYGNDGQFITSARFANGEQQWFINDAFGNVVKAIRSDGTVVAEQTYDAFGRVRSGAGLSIGYANAFTDNETGFVFLRTRWYAPEMGRFTSADSAGASPFDPRTLNRYTYSFNDPVNHSDPTGQFSVMENLTTISLILSTLTIGQYVYQSGGVGAAVSNLFTGFAGSLKFDKLSGLSFPALTGSLGTKGLSAFGFGLEVVNFTKFSKNVLYAYYGPNLSVGFKDPYETPKNPFSALNPTINVGANKVYDTPTGDSYTGWFFGFSGAGIGVVGFFMAKVNGAAFAMGLPLANTYAYSPTETYEDKGVSRYSHTIGFLPIGVPLADIKNFYASIGPNNFSVGISLTNYIRIT
jgi:RHS repeat-associated protein